MAQITDPTAARQEVGEAARGARQFALAASPGGRRRMAFRRPTEFAVLPLRAQQVLAHYFLVMSVSHVGRNAAHNDGEDHDLAARRLQAVIGALPSGVLLEDEHRRIVRTNDAFCALFGVLATPEQLIGADCAAAAEQSKQLFVEPELFIARVDAMLAGRVPVSSTVLRMVDGRVLELDYRPVWIDDVYRGHLWNYRDVTEKVLEREKIDGLKGFYEQVLNSMPAQLAVFDADLRYRFVSPSAIASEETRAWIVGHNDIEYAIRRGLDPSIGEQRMASLRRVLETGEARAFEESFPNRAGELLTFMRYIAPVRGPDGTIQQILGYGLDITEIRRAQAAVMASRDVAERAVADRERFLATMSHEIRTPLNAILGTAHLLPTTPLSNQQREYVAAIRLSAEGLLRIINDILDFGRISSGELEFEAQPFRPYDVIEGIVTSLRFTAERKGIRLSAEMDLTLSSTFVGDAGRLHQILLNLVANAIKFTERGHVTVCADHDVTADGTHALVVSVVDTGVGIAPERFQRIFDPFVQERDDTSRHFGGTGLGLAIVKEFVERQGGRVSVESTAGAGSTFRVWLPMPLADVARAPDEDRLDGADDGPRLDGVRVLVAEDNPLNQIVVSHLLQHAGAQVVLADTGQKVVEILRRDRAFGCVLMDIHMPVMDGLAATRLIRGELGLSAGTLPIIALTAESLGERRDEAAAAGMNGFVLKPFRPAELRMQIRRLLPKTTAKTRSMRLGAVAGPEKEPLVDRRRLLGLTVGDLPFAARVLQMFLRDCPAQVARILELGRGGDAVALSEAAHRLRSGAVTMGATRLHVALGRIEANANDPARLPDDLADLADVASATLGALQAWQRELPPPEANDDV